jgi:hypothetical protein
MTDSFSATFAVAGLNGIFTACVVYFEYIQLGQKFGKDYQRSLLKLDDASFCLSRWDELVKIYKGGHDSQQQYQIRGD